MLGALEPEVEAIAPIAGGSRLSSLSARSTQAGIPEAFVMRAMGPTFQATLATDGSTRIFTQVTERGRLVDIPIRQLVPPSRLDELGRPGSDVTLQPGDTMLASNLDRGTVGCAYLLADEFDNDVAARARASLPSNRGDRVTLAFYRGPVLRNADKHCALIEAPGDPLLVIEQVAPPQDAEGNLYLYEGRPIAGGPLIALTEGLGLKRSTPQLRRFIGLGQMMLDPADPGAVARYLAQEPLEYPLKGDRTGARFLAINPVGDMRVPTSNAVALARAMGAIDYLQADPRFGVPPNPGTHRHVYDRGGQRLGPAPIRHPAQTPPAPRDSGLMHRVVSTLMSTTFRPAKTSGATTFPVSIHHFACSVRRTSTATISADSPAWFFHTRPPRAKQASCLQGN